MWGLLTLSASRTLTSNCFGPRHHGINTQMGPLKYQTCNVRFLPDGAHLQIESNGCQHALRGADGWTCHFLLELLKEAAKP